MFKKKYTPWNKGKKISPKLRKKLAKLVIIAGLKTRFKKGMVPWNKGEKLDYKTNGSFKKGMVPWNKGLKKRLNTGKTHFKKGHVPWTKGKKIPQFSGKNHPMWKGNKVGYGALHDWVRNILGCPKKCDRCGTINAKKYEWANKSGKYLRNINDWERLCNSCHKLNPVKMHKRFKKL